MNKKSEDKKIIKRLNELADSIDKHNLNYHTKDQPIISDWEYDKLVKENLELEKKYPNLKIKFSPTNQVGGKILNKFTKSNHLSPMHSLLKPFDKECMGDK